VGHPLITALERQQRDARRVSVFLDDAFAFGVVDDVVYRFGLAKGMEMPPELRARIEADNAVLEARRAAERSLARRMRTGKEMAAYLRGKEFPETAIATVVEDLTRLHLLDDRAFAEAFVRDRLRFRPRSRSVIERELIAKGVEKSVARAVLAELLGDETEWSTALALAEKFLRQHASLEEDARKRRVFGFLQRKGYSPSGIFRVLHALGLDA
jgi:regulatory protein